MSLDYTLTSVNAFCAQGILGVTGLQFLQLRPDFAEAAFLITPSLHQPSGILNGGVSLLIAESVASVAANCALQGKAACVGIEINASHLQPMVSGVVKVETRPCRIGRTLQVWQVDFFREDGKLSCVARVSLMLQRQARVGR